MRLSQISWIIYDRANSAWFTVIPTVFFPVLLREYWSSHNCPTKGLAISANLNSVNASLFRGQLS